MIELMANKELFEKWNLLGRDIQLHRSIAQNDIEVSQEQVDCWFELMTDLQNEFQSLIGETVEHYDLERSLE